MLGLIQFETYMQMCIPFQIFQQEKSQAPDVLQGKSWALQEKSKALDFSPTRETQTREFPAKRNPNRSSSRQETDIPTSKFLKMHMRICMYVGFYPTYLQLCLHVWLSRQGKKFQAADLSPREILSTGFLAKRNPNFEAVDCPPREILSSGCLAKGNPKWHTPCQEKSQQLADFSPAEISAFSLHVQFKHFIPMFSSHCLVDILSEPWGPALRSKTDFNFESSLGWAFSLYYLVVGPNPEIARWLQNTSSQRVLKRWIDHDHYQYI